MTPSTTYEIHFSGLALGIHHFDWKLEPLFFQRFDIEEIIESELHAKVSLDKKDRLMILEFKIDGKVKTLCDLCGGEVWVKTKAKDEIIARFSDETDFTNDEVIYLDNSEYRLDVSQFIYEFSILAVPTRRTHIKGECIQDIAEYLQDIQEDSIDENDIIDPRWEALKKLK